MEEFEPQNRGQWRNWLSEHHEGSAGVWLILGSRVGGARPLTIEDAVEEALCFGWIDSTLHRLEAGRSALRFTPRRPDGAWSRANKDRVRDLIERGLMTEAGLKAVSVARENGAWELLDDVEALRVPEDLARALAVDSAARANFEQFPPSAKKAALWWVSSAKRPATRSSRIAETVRLAAENRSVVDGVRRTEGRDPGQDSR